MAGPCAGSLSAALMAPRRGQPPAASGAPPPCPPRAPRAAGISPWPSLSYSCVRGLIPPELLGSESHAAAFRSLLRFQAKMTSPLFFQRLASVPDSVTAPPEAPRGGRAPPEAPRAPATLTGTWPAPEGPPRPVGSASSPALCSSPLVPLSEIPGNGSARIRKVGAGLPAGTEGECARGPESRCSFRRGPWARGAQASRFLFDRMAVSLEGN